MENVQPGWYPDPSGDATKLRYWDGAQWTTNVADAQAANQGAGQGALYVQPGYDQAYYQQAQSASSDSDRTLALVAFVFCIISTVTAGWLLVPLIWMIPMSVISWGIYKGTKANTVAFGVCTLLFVSIVAGICLLARKKDA